jgi:hypothetical protein
VVADARGRCAAVRHGISSRQARSPMADVLRAVVKQAHDLRVQLVNSLRWSGCMRILIADGQYFNGRHEDCLNQPTLAANRPTIRGPSYTARKGYERWGLVCCPGRVQSEDCVVALRNTDIPVGELFSRPKPPNIPRLWRRKRWRCGDRRCTLRSAALALSATWHKLDQTRHTSSLQASVFVGGDELPLR